VLPPEARIPFGAGLGLAVTLIVLTAALADETPQQKLRSVERELEQGRKQQEELSRQADALALELQSLREGGIRAAEAVQAREAALSTLEAQL
jgi:septal ring factor EnvC (AmiA/AmiB activator)